MKPKLITLIGIIFISFNGYTQKIKFGNITTKDFEQKIYTIDSAAQAVILYDGGAAKYESDGSAWFNVIYTYHKRVRILNKNAFDLATVKIPLYIGDRSEEKLDKIEAATYTLQNGEVVKTKLDRQSIFKDKASKNSTIQKFTFPNLSEGCIIEYTYTIISPRAYDLRAWYFQDKFPVLQSKYEVTIPTLFNHVFLKNGYYELPETSVTEGNQSYTIFLNRNSSERTESFVYNAKTIHSEWTLANIPALVPEKFTTTLENYISKIEFQLKSLNYPDEAPKPYMQTWAELAKVLLKSDYFGADLSKNNRWLDDDVEKLIIKNDNVQTAKNIFKYVKENYTCTNYQGIQLDENLKKSYQEKKGNVADINLVLVAMLKKAKLNVDPVLISTREHGLAFEIYPLIDRFNYVIAKVEINNKTYLLDASNRHMGFNFLPEHCYNGSGRIISENPFTVMLSADSLKESKNTNIFIVNTEDGKKIEGSFTSNLGYFESFNIRDNLSKVNKEDFFKKIKNGFNYDVKMSNTSLDSLNNEEEKIAVKYDFSFSLNDDVVYFNPLFGEAYKTNPFTAAKRSYPVEMPYQTNETIIVNMEIPKGYKVDELPKSARVSFNENEGMFEYLIQADAESIQLRCRIILNKANFEPVDYETLRDFYAQIVKKQSEQIVFKKIK
jgi:transglutaminase-like putative cysteine protease